MAAREIMYSMGMVKILGEDFSKENKISHEIKGDDFLEIWRQKIEKVIEDLRGIWELRCHEREWPYIVDEEETCIGCKEEFLEIEFLSEGKEIVVENYELLNCLGSWKTDRFCIPWEWMEEIIRELAGEI